MRLIGCVDCVKWRTCSVDATWPVFVNTQSCRVCAGINLSAMVLVCMCLDRYRCIVRPLSTLVAPTRLRPQLGLAWTLALLTSMPQLIMFKVAELPNRPNYYQCVSLAFVDKSAKPYAFAYSMVHKSDVHANFDRFPIQCPQLRTGGSCLIYKRSSQ
jgi:hypothetical protein